ncbi:MAG: type II toxin-antitoxin system prevent-host-death family antitoxin [Clostridiales Family XIII bacterium]|jgi:prevent-host-death family protein|nr:type II toxin-antitoxin system prevent-host-death family antitoxin [Clostridiales Family XIII bacterium]
MKQYNIHETKTHLSALVERVAAGEPFIIAKAGRPIAVVHPYNPVAPRPRTGFLKGRVSVPSDFDHMGGNEIAALFEEMP